MNVSAASLEALASGLDCLVEDLLWKIPANNEPLERWPQYSHPRVL
jgi:hypothetical protein